MKRITRLGVGCLLLCVSAFLALGEGPDDLFVQIYNLIQQADALRASGQRQEADARYLAARTVLDQLETNHPKWNPKIVKYRRAYIAERLATDAPAATPPADTSTSAPASPPAPAPTPTLATAGTALPQPEAKPVPLDQTAALRQEIGNLRAERDTLQAKLREALTVQPAAVDPRELAKAERHLEELRRENESLKTSVAEQQAKLAGGVDPAVHAQAQQALKEANASLERQTQSVSALTKERDSLREQLKRASDKTQARAAREQAKAAKSQPAPAPGTAGEADAKADELAARLKQAQDALETERRRSEKLLAEKNALENRVTLLSSAQPAASATAVPTNLPPATTAPTVTVPPSAKPATARATKADRAAEKAWIKQLERERDDLRKRVAALTREVEDRKVRGGTTQQDRVAEELAILRARIQVYEARRVPYTPEELALFKATAEATNRGETSAPKRGARQVPAGAAALVAEAQRAFQGRRLEEAERKFQQALILDDKNVGLLVNLAATHVEQGQLEAAETVLKRAMAQDPNDPDALALLGLVRFRQAKYDEAMDILGRAAQYNPDNAVTQNYLGVTLSQKGQRGPAERAFRKAIQLAPNYAEAHYNLALAYVHQEPPSRELARWHYQKALAGGQPQNAEIEKLLDAKAAPTSAK